MIRKKVENLLNRLTGQEIPIICDDPQTLGFDYEQMFSEGICYSQLNEILLHHGYDRISEDFYVFLIELSSCENTNNPNVICSVDHFERIIESYNIIALLAYGNIKFAFKTLAIDKEQVEYCSKLILSKDGEYYKNRPSLARSLSPIEPEKTFYLGYMIKGEIEKEIKRNPNSEHWKNEDRILQETIKKGVHNNDAYLISHEMDVYVATSMRNKHEFILIYEFVHEIFNNEKIKPLNLRYFDPTQAFCEDRIDKGVTEALMLKRADCTIYLAQEKDTLGKDSELASTLAQGKPVIAFVPIGDQGYANRLLETMKRYNEEKTEKQLILDYLCIFDPELAWQDEHIELREWINDPESSDKGKLLTLFYNAVERIYDKRARDLKETHPLGIQINLKTGVANGVLVVRKIEDCVEVLRSAILNELRYNLDPMPDEDLYLPIGKETIKLVESHSKSIHRVMSKNQLLSNTFWNFYTLDN